MSKFGWTRKRAKQRTKRIKSSLIGDVEAPEVDESEDTTSSTSSGVVYDRKTPSFRNIVTIAQEIEQHEGNVIYPTFCDPAINPPRLPDSFVGSEIKTTERKITTPMSAVGGPVVHPSNCYIIEEDGRQYIYGHPVMPSGCVVIAEDGTVEYRGAEINPSLWITPDNQIILPDSFAGARISASGCDFQAEPMDRNWVYGTTIYPSYCIYQESREMIYGPTIGGWYCGDHEIVLPVHLPHIPDQMGNELDPPVVIYGGVQADTPPRAVMLQFFYDRAGTQPRPASDLIDDDTSLEEAIMAHWDPNIMDVVITINYDLIDLMHVHIHEIYVRVIYIT